MIFFYPFFQTTVVSTKWPRKQFISRLLNSFKDNNISITNLEDPSNDEGHDEEYLLKAEKVIRNRLIKVCHNT